MLDTVAAVMTEGLRASGIDAVERFPDERLGKPEAPVVAVGVKSGKILGSGLGEYLGIDRGDGTSGERELYGLRLELGLALDIYCPVRLGAAGCAKCFSEISAALPALPEGLKFNVLECSEAAVDKVTGLMLSRAVLRCTAYMTAEREAGSEEEFLDYRLRGVITGNGKQNGKDVGIDANQ